MALAQLTFPCRLGADPLGIPSGPDFARFLRAAYDNTGSTAWNVPCPKAGRTLDALSSLEQGAIYDAILDPRVLDVRPQYPMADFQRLEAYVKDPSLRIPRTKVPTMDLLLTVLDSTKEQGFWYEAISVKPLEELSDPAVQRRFQRDQKFCDDQGWPWYLYTEREFSEQRIKSSRYLVRRVVEKDLQGMRTAAQAAATVISRFSDGRNLRCVAAAMSRSLATTRTRALDLIAAAALFGFISIDLERAYDLSSPLVLLPRPAP